MKDKLVKIVLTIVLTILVAVLIMATLLMIFKFKPEKPITKLGSGWEIAVNDETKAKSGRISDIPDIIKDGLKRGSRITLTRRLGNEVMWYHTPTLIMGANYSAVEAFLDGKKIYSEDMDKFRKGSFISKNKSYIDLPEVKAGAELKLVYHLSESGLNPGIQVPELGNFLDLHRSFLNNNIFPLFTGIFLCMFGLFFMVVSLVLRPAFPEVIGQLVSAVLSLIFGLYVLSADMLTQIFFHSGHTGDVEYVSLFLMVPFMYMLFSQIHEIEKKRLYQVLSVGSSVIIAVLFVLHFTNVVHMVSMRILYFILLSVMSIVLLVYDVKDVRNKRFDLISVTQMTGPTVFCLCALPCSLYSIMMEAVLKDNPNRQMIIVIIAAGCTIFAVSRLFIFFLLLSETDQRVEEFKALTHNVYHDPLTDAFNSSYYEETLDRLDQSYRGYAIMNVKLEGLSDITYEKGHSKSDGWLKVFGESMSTNTPSPGSAFRIDNDTFAMISYSGERGVLEHIVENLARAMRFLDCDVPDVQHRISCGIAYSDELEQGHSREIAALAEERRSPANY